MKEAPGSWPLASLCDDGGLIPSKVLGQLADLKSDLDQALQSILSIPHQLLLICFRREVTFDVHPNGSTLTSSTRQPPDDAGSILEGDDLSLVLADAPIDRVRVVEVVCFGDLEAGTGRLGLVFRANEGTGLDRLFELVHEFLSSGRLYLFVIVAGEEGTTVDLVMPQEQIVDADQFVGRRLVGGGEDVEPG